MSGVDGLIEYYCIGRRIYSYNEVYSLALRVSYDYLNYFEN
jgi:hypothetical protein